MDEPAETVRQAVRAPESGGEIVETRARRERTGPSLKAYLLDRGYAGDAEDAFDRAMREVREGPPAPFAPRAADVAD